jgi:glycosyltransferase involved in cell wall biosynthesis
LASRGLQVTLVARPGPQTDGITELEVVSPERFASWRGGLDVLHVCGLFLVRQLTLAWRVRRKAAITVLSPFGHLMEHHVQRRKWKKGPYLAVVQQVAARWRHHAHLFSEAEESGAQRYLRASGYFEASLGIFSPPEASVAAAAESGDFLLFFGRNDIYQKGIDLLTAGYAIARGQGLRLPLVIAGAQSNGSEAALRRVLSDLNLMGSIHLAGRVREEEKWNLLAQARALVFPSRWDGPPRPIREAIAVGTPIIVSPETNLAGFVQSAGAGLSVGLTPELVAQALLCSQDETTVQGWRQGARQLRNTLSWDRVAEQYLTGYDRALCGRTSAE